MGHGNSPKIGYDNHDKEKDMVNYSFSPAGEKFGLPEKEDYLKEFERLKELVGIQRSLGREIVVVMGRGFVGAGLAAVVADAEDGKGNSSKFVIGMQRTR